MKLVINILLVLFNDSNAKFTGIFKQVPPHFDGIMSYDK